MDAVTELFEGGGISRPGGAGHDVPPLPVILRQRAEEEPDRVAYTYLPDGEVVGEEITYAELDRQARAIAAHLQQIAAPGERALMLYPSGLEFVAALFGCLYAGIVPTPSTVPDVRRLQRSLFRLQAIADDADAAAVLAPDAIAQGLREHVAGMRLSDLPWIGSEVVAREGWENWSERDPHWNEMALLQYTSGSTSMPKGVVLDHSQVLVQCQIAQRTFQTRPDTPLVSWLPLFHDLGLFMSVMQPVFAGLRSILLPPHAFLQRPARWLEAITEYRGVISGGPNFAFDLCARKVTFEERAALDLSSWKACFSGGEPVRAETLDRFVKAFGPVGYDRRAMMPCWGLAEAACGISTSEFGKGAVVKAFDREELENGRAVEVPLDDPNGRRLVGNGRFVEHHGVIVDPETHRRLGDGEVGELWIAGPCVAWAYWKRVQDTEDTFLEFVDDGDGPFMRTGDLGFLVDDELFVPGRLKDLIIIRGRNLVPADIEATAERAHEDLRPGCGAAIAVEREGEEALVVVQEVRDPDAVSVEQVTEAIRRAVTEEHGVQPADVRLIAPRSIAKTSSGKLQRQLIRRQYLEGELDDVLEGTAAAGVA